MSGSMDLAGKCPECGRQFKNLQAADQHRRDKHGVGRPPSEEQHRAAINSDPEMRPDWSRGCENCGAKPIMPLTGMCGPCTTGEADTIGGNW